MPATTPLMNQYLGIKKQYPDCILFFRMGDFYEMFFDDAKVASTALNIALTSRSKNKDEPMCGIPYHSLQGYLAKMVTGGYKVAICEQLENPKGVKGIVKRGVVRVVTPGTLTEDFLLKDKEPNFLAAISEGSSGYGLAMLELSTGSFSACEFHGMGAEQRLVDELSRLNPKEVIIPEGLKEGSILARITKESDLWFESFDFLYFQPEEATRLLCRLFGTSSLEGFGLGNMPLAISACGGAVGYAGKQSPSAIDCLRTIKPINLSLVMEMDRATIQNLELVANLSGNGTEGTLLEVIDKTKTAMGGRLLRQRLLSPLINQEEIEKRLNLVDSFFAAYKERGILRELLSGLTDFERAAHRVAGKSFNPRDFSSIAKSLLLLPKIYSAISTLTGSEVEQLLQDKMELAELAALLNHAVAESHPATWRDLGFVREGYSQKLDEVRSFSANAAGQIKDMEAREKKRTGISTLRFKYNKIYGYFIEVSKRHSGDVPPEWIRKQSLVNSERYLSPELKMIEERLAGSDEEAMQIEQKIIDELRDEVIAALVDIRDAAVSIAEIDVGSSLAEVAEINRYCRPQMTGDRKLILTAARHPVIERLMVGETFVPNDIWMDEKTETLMVITGPNMAGKSTYLRQSALAFIMAQCGSYVAAEKAVIGMADRIFTRVGAQDRLQKGMSTFMVEMVETANILNNATEKSFVILDEIGRGTSTFDGLSIAWAVAEHLANLGSRTLFATHYHELSEMAITHKGVANYNVSAKEYDDRLLFMRRLEAGAADKSYGIQVAKLAGLPEGVLCTARKVLQELENMEYKPDGKPALRRHEPTTEEDEQISLFDARNHPVLEVLRSADINNMTPMDSLQLLQKLSAKLREEA